MDDTSATPQARLQAMLNGFRVTQVVYVAAKLGLADLLADGPRSADELAAATQTNADALYRVLRALASIGVFEEVTPRSFSLSPIASLLQANHPDSARAQALMQGDDVYSVWGDLLLSVQTGAPAAERHYGMPRFAYLAQHPALSAIFDQFMSENARRDAAAVVAAYDFSAARTLVDVGGGQGALLAAILQANPQLHGVLFDQPHVVEGAEPTLAAAGVLERCERVGGDMFAAPPPSGDLLILRHIIHDWDDERSIVILRSCAQSLAPGGKILLVERVIEPGNQASAAKFLDLTMLVMLGGRERAAEEFGRLLTAAGLRLARIIPTTGEESIIEGEFAS